VRARARTPARALLAWDRDGDATATFVSDEVFGEVKLLDFEAARAYAPTTHRCEVWEIPAGRRSEFAPRYFEDNGPPAEVRIFPLTDALLSAGCWAVFPRQLSPKRHLN
jgi:hypothetical protein